MSLLVGKVESSFLKKYNIRSHCHIPGPFLLDHENIFALN